MKREKSKKYICLIIGFLMLVTGCGKKIDNDKIIKYLENKYNQNFSYVSSGDDVWSSKSETKIFSDNNNQKFKVKVFSDYIADTYYSIIYDDEISKYYQNQFTKNYKIFASSESYFTNENQKYSEAKGKVFSIAPFYAEMCDLYKIYGYQQFSDYKWLDVGKPETLAQAEEMFK